MIPQKLKVGDEVRIIAPSRSMAILKDDCINLAKERLETKTNKTDIEGATVTRARGARFTPPTVDDVRAYCSEHGYSVDADRFVAYYESNGWRVGRNPMKDWRAAVRTWTRNGYSRGGGVTSGANSKPDEDLFAGFSPEDIAEIERLANDGEHFG